MSPGEAGIVMTEVSKVLEESPGLTAAAGASVCTILVDRFASSCGMGLEASSAS